MFSCDYMKCPAASFLAAVALSFGVLSSAVTLAAEEGKSAEESFKLGNAHFEARRLEEAVV